VANLLSALLLATGLAAATASAPHLAAAGLLDDSRKIKGQLIVDVARGTEVPDQREV
jgi:hypothetical protein